MQGPEDSRPIYFPFPSMFRPKPLSEKSQDISHLLTNLFKKPIHWRCDRKGKGASLLKSRGGDNAYHEKFVGRITKVRTEHATRMREADMVERHIIQARARATAEEERALNMQMEESGAKFDDLKLPPVDSYFRWCVSNNLLKKHNLICPEDYITDLVPLTRAPKGEEGVMESETPCCSHAIVGDYVARMGQASAEWPSVQEGDALPKPADNAEPAHLSLQEEEELEMEDGCLQSYKNPATSLLFSEEEDSTMWASTVEPEQPPVAALDVPFSRFEERIMSQNDRIANLFEGVQTELLEMKIVLQDILEKMDSASPKASPSPSLAVASHASVPPPPPLPPMLSAVKKRCLLYNQAVLLSTFHPRLLAHETPDLGYLKETICFKQHISRSPVDDGYTELQPPLPIVEPSISDSILTLSSLSETKIPVKKLSSKKSRTSMKPHWKDDMRCADRVQNRLDLTQLENRHNFLKNPRFFPPDAMYGGRSLITSLKKTERLIAGRKKVFQESDPLLPVPVFLSNPPIVIFSEYEIGKTYEMTIELRNMTAASRHIRIIPPSTPCFSIGLGKFPGEGGIVAPGMSCHYTVRFAPDSLGDFNDFLIVESQALYPLLIPLEARRLPPVLTLPRTLDCGPCLIGGVKVLEIVCRNEGLSCGRFCIMPKNKWPPANFRSITDTKFVEEVPFGIRPTLFQLYPGQAILLEVFFFPHSVAYFQKIFTIVCDNCQIKDFTIKGIGQLIGLELIAVSGGESRPVLGELTDLTAEYLVHFDSSNPYTTSEKKLLIRNTTHVTLPFYWQIMKPNLQALRPGESPDPDKIKYDQDIETAFSINPAHGALPPHCDSEFTLSYTPKELKNFHSVVQMVLMDIPEPPGSEKQEKMLGEIEPMTTDVIVLDIDVKGFTEPYKVLLEPYAIILSGENLIGVTIRKPFKMWNNSKTVIVYEWETIIDCDIIQIEPYTGKLEPNECCELEMSFTGGKTRFISHQLQCKIQNSSEPVVLHIEATFKGPHVTIDIPSLQLGLIKLGEKTVSLIQIENTSQLPAKWRMQESQACITGRNEKMSQFTITPSSGELLPLSSATVSVLFYPLIRQHLHTVLELEIENGEDSHLSVYADVQTPQACLLSSHLLFSDIYVGIPAQEIVILFNQGFLPAKYTWGKLSGSHSTNCSVIISSAHGTLGPNEEVKLIIELTTYTLDELSDLTICCHVEDMKNPLVLSLSAKAKGLHVTYSVFCEKEFPSSEQMSSIPDAVLNFGSEVMLHSTEKRYLLLTNHTAIAAPFTLKALFFSGHPPPSNKQETSLSLASLMKRTKRFEIHAANKAQYDYAAAVLSDGKGAAFLSQPPTGTLEAFQQFIIEVSAYNDMWGEYTDELVCKVGDLKPIIIPIRLSVKGCPVYFQMTGPRPDCQTIIRFGTHISGGDTISRSLRINNTCPYDIRIDWEMYNQETDGSQLLDFRVFYGDPFPLKDIDGNEIIGSGSDYSISEDIVSNWDKIPNSSATLSSLSPVTDEHIVSFTPLMLSDGIKKIECEGFALGFLTLHRKSCFGYIAAEGSKPAPTRIWGSEMPPMPEPQQEADRKLAQMGPQDIGVPLSGAARLELIAGRQEGSVLLNFPDSVSLNWGELTGPRHSWKGDSFTRIRLKPVRLEFRAIVKLARLTIETDDDEGMVFYSLASDLISDHRVSKILTESVTTRNLKLINSTQTPLYFRLLLSKPFGLLGIDPNKSVKTSHSDRDEQGGHLVLHPQQNMLLQVSFCTTLELLTYQNMPADQMAVGVQLLQSENGEKKLKFSQHLEIEYSNKSVQQVHLYAYLTVPVLQLSCETVDFGTCFIGQTRTQEVFLLNKSKSKSYWTALIDKQDKHSQQEIFSVSPISGMLEACVTLLLARKEALLISFTARKNKEYETAMMIHGMLGEKPCRLQLRGQGSYDEKYDVLY
ncbi:deleted in lung and esophageal cancer protein 1 [Rhinatrema bivittatum]|uniref:deleted in lung and esophageal cancer protein 1 n=1 Tax=Rhinatrema bivittatum TaxID=194408 RepID=UPI001129CA6D|nr:deleted in lung and esophageal cancer protein 1 [Rhinatrema bivittatum]